MPEVPGIPVAFITGFEWAATAKGSARRLLRSPEKDLFL